MYILSVSLSVCLMCVNVSVDQLALTHSPPLSEIFVFTDASPKDHHLQRAVQALILEKQTKVTHKHTGYIESNIYAIIHSGIKFIKRNSSV